MAERPTSGSTHALRESNTKFASRVSTDAMESALRSNYARMGLEPEVWDGLHTSLDLTVEIKVARANVVRYSTMLAAGEQFIMAPNGTPQSIEVLYNQSLMIVRQLVKAQSEVAPGVERSGQIALTIKVDGGVPTQTNRMPDLTEDGDDDDASLPKSEASMMEEKPSSPSTLTGYETDSD